VRRKGGRRKAPRHREGGWMNRGVDEDEVNVEGKWMEFVRVDVFRLVLMSAFGQCGARLFSFFVGLVCFLGESGLSFRVGGCVHCELMCHTSQVWRSKQLMGVVKLFIRVWAPKRDQLGKTLGVLMYSVTGQPICAAPQSMLNLIIHRELLVIITKIGV
jgi:hypothetical protein